MKTNNKIALLLVIIISLFTSIDILAQCGGGGCSSCSYYGSCDTWSDGGYTGGYVGFGGTTACPMCENTCGSCEATYRSCAQNCSYNAPLCGCNYGDYSY